MLEISNHQTCCVTRQLKQCAAVLPSRFAIRCGRKCSRRRELRPARRARFNEDCDHGDSEARCTSRTVPLEEGTLRGGKKSAVCSRGTKKDRRGAGKRRGVGSGCFFPGRRGRPAWYRHKVRRVLMSFAWHACAFAPGRRTFANPLHDHPHRRRRQHRPNSAPHRPSSPRDLNRGYSSFRLTVHHQDRLSS